ncbi:hypothetical protein [Spartinivicinus poritis]|uniref:Uncharacterized protein n=1 Tax=Spartinivicinus poritis TaxID=2994640 RepID=A0ABT5U9V4_9GAMM|nr:hypothetical protein [Spartinivicinus sp. A2-2]MDE1463160.1 hypothetical protein [Spartinivicinus sp. A2-2]
MTITANVLYPLKLRGMLLWVAYQEGFTPVWSTEILDEWIRNLKRNNPELCSKKLEKSCAQVNQGFPYACVTHEKLSSSYHKYLNYQMKMTGMSWLLHWPVKLII